MFIFTGLNDSKYIYDNMIDFVKFIIIIENG